MSLYLTSEQKATGKTNFERAVGRNALNRRDFISTFGDDPTEVFPEEFDALFEMGLVTEVGDYLHLTPLGVRHRELLHGAALPRRVGPAPAAVGQLRVHGHRPADA